MKVTEAAKTDFHFIPCPLLRAPVPVRQDLQGRSERWVCSLARGERREVLPLCCRMSPVEGTERSPRLETAGKQGTGIRTESDSVVEVHRKFGKEALLVRKDRLKFPQLQSGIICLLGKGMMSCQQSRVFKPWELRDPGKA